MRSLWLHGRIGVLSHIQMEKENALNIQALPDGSRRLVSANKFGQLVVEQLNHDLHVRYQRTIPGMTVEGINSSEQHRDAAAEIKSRLWSMDSTIRNHLFKLLSNELSDEGDRSDLGFAPRKTLAVSHHFNGRQLVVDPIASETAANIKVLPGTSIRDALYNWLVAAGFEDARARDESIDAGLQPSDRGYGGTGIHMPDERFDVIHHL